MALQPSSGVAAAMLMSSSRSAASIAAISFAISCRRRDNAARSRGGQFGSATVVATRSLNAANNSRCVPHEAASVTDFLLGAGSPAATARNFRVIPPPEEKTERIEKPRQESRRFYTQQIFRAAAA
jgi:hypothetical protein